MCIRDSSYGATGENPVIVNVRNADLIIGPIGIVMADSLMGEITAAMATAVSSSSAYKILIPVNRCNHFIAGCQGGSLSAVSYTHLSPYFFTAFLMITAWLISGPPF